MGVMATYCQVCGLPVQWDQYVPMDGMSGIWRGGEDREVCEPLVAFGPEHEWLKKAVGLRLDKSQEPVVIRGAVHDGAFDDEFDDGLVMRGVEDRAAMHEACWKLAGMPASCEELPRIKPDKILDVYCEQLFEFEEFIKDGRGWMLVDPTLKTAAAVRNRRRIAKLLNP